MSGNTSEYIKRRVVMVVNRLRYGERAILIRRYMTEDYMIMKFTITLV
jgi:hypothetical protein